MSGLRVAEAPVVLPGARLQQREITRHFETRRAILGLTATGSRSGCESDAHAFKARTRARRFGEDGGGEQEGQKTGDHARIILIPAVCQLRSASGWNRCMKWRFGSQVSATRCQVFSIRSGFGIIPAPAPEPENLNLIPDRWDPGPENVSPPSNPPVSGFPLRYAYPA